MTVIKIYIIICVFKFFAWHVNSDNFGQSPNFGSFDGNYIDKDIDMCTMFIQSYTLSIDMNMTVKDYLLRHTPYSYSYNGHLHIFTQYENDYSFLLASTINKMEEQNEVHQKNKYSKSANKFSENDNVYDAYNGLNYEFIDWNQESTKIYYDIIEKFHVDKECNSIITFYLTFPSYPKNGLLLNFIESFQKNSYVNMANLSSTNENENLKYRQNINPSFLSFVDKLPLFIFQQLFQQKKNVRLVLCGHGLGGTIAQLSTLHLLSKGLSFHPIQLQSISIGSLFFAKELTMQYIQNHHFERHFINIYHEMDPIPTLFNSAEILSKFINTTQKENRFWSFIKYIFGFGDKIVEQHRHNLKIVLTWLCHGAAGYIGIPNEGCGPKTIDTAINILQTAIHHIKKYFDKDTVSKLVHQPIGIYNMISFRKYDRTWHLININNEEALFDHLNNTLERLIRLTQSKNRFENHSIKTYLTDLQQCNKQKSEFNQIQTMSTLISSFPSNEKFSLNSDSNYSIVIPLPFRFSNYSYNPMRSGKSYMSMISISSVYPSDTPISHIAPSNYLEKQLLSAIKHRTGVLKINSKNMNEKKRNNSTNQTNIYDVLLEMYKTYGIDARMELMKLQLDQRMLVPILVSTNKKGYPPFRSYIKTLTLVETPILQLKENLLAFDSNLLRIGLISTIKKKTGGLPDLINQVFHTLSIRMRIPGTGSGISVQTAVEIGYGFLPNPKSPLSYEAIIIVHVIGNYHPLISFLVQYVDALIVEHNEDNQDFDEFHPYYSFDSLRIEKIMQWKHTIDAEFNGINEINEPYPIDEFEGSVNAVTAAFQEHLLEILHLKSYRDKLYSFRPRLVDIIEDNILFFDDVISIIDMKTFFENIDTSYIKKEIFQLQQSYKIEAENQLKLDNPTIQLHSNKQKELEDNIRQQRKFRSEIYEIVTNNSLFQLYISILAESDNEKRYIDKRQFEFVLSEYNEKTISILQKRKDETFIDMSNAINDVIRSEKNYSEYSFLLEEQKRATTKHYEAKQEFISTSLVSDHFWREISHLFVTNKSLFSTYPHLAAQHVIDGFSLELLDGDSMLLNIEWLEAVFDSLNKKLNQELNRKARILVLSICGPQSSGKSFLLKTMFGIRIKSSVGACTQGVNMMLVKVYQHDYDYILLLDTEGIRAPEFMNLPDTVLRDNTLVTFSILPADGTILLNKGEVNQALEEVLPTVLLVYATSSLSLQLGGQMPSKLFFVYSQIDVSQEAKGKEILQDLTTRLYNITNQIRESISLKNSSFHGFEHCRLDLRNMSNSDFRILTINTNNPPINHPVYLYGEQALQLRQWIDQRIVNTSEPRAWKARSISDILDYLKISIDTIRQAHPITNVNTALEMLANNKLNERIEKIKYKISENFTTIRIEVEDEIIRRYTNRSSDQTDISTLSQTEIINLIDDGHEEVLKRMSDFIHREQQTIYTLVKDTKRETALKDGWELFLNEKKSRSKNFLAIRIDREITIASIIDNVQNKIRQDLIDKCDQINCKDFNEKQQEDIFNEIFHKRIEELSKPYISSEANVSHGIKAVYNKSLTIETVKIFNDKQFCGKNGSFHRMSYEQQELKHQKNMESDQERRDRRRRYMEDNKKYNNIIDEIRPQIDSLCSNTQRYDEVIVSSALRDVDRLISVHGVILIDTIQDIHRQTFCYLEYHLTKLQNDWDSNHNYTLHLERNRHVLWGFFQQVSQGIRGMKLLQFDLFAHFQQRWKKGFIENLIQMVKTKVSQQRWIENSDILSAYIDNEKIQILESKGIEGLLQETRSAYSFYEKCLEKLVQTHVDSYADKKWKVFYDSIIDTIKEAGNEAKDSPKNCLKIFLNVLLNSTLPWEIRSGLPSNVAIYGSVDDQPRSIFDGMVTNITSAIPQQPESKLNGDESKKVLEAIRQDPSTDYAKPRCNHACALCGAPCHRPFNHTGHHDFHHQPAGVAGFRTYQTRLIIHETCLENFLRSHSFTIDNGTSIHSYSEFPEVFGYEIPNGANKRNLFSEYLMNKYHEEIAKFYGIEPNPPVPVAYEKHTLDDVKAYINKTINLHT